MWLNDNALFRLWVFSWPAKALQKYLKALQIYQNHICTTIPKFHPSEFLSFKTNCKGRILHEIRVGKSAPSFDSCHCSYSLLSWKNHDAISTNNIICVWNVDIYILCVDLCKGCGIQLHLFCTVCHLEEGNKRWYQQFPNIFAKMTKGV